MNIREAITEANKKHLSFRRESWKRAGVDKWILPTNDVWCCLELTGDMFHKPESSRWAPRASDITADDWTFN